LKGACKCGCSDCGLLETLFEEFPEMEFLAGTLKGAKIGMGVQAGRVW